MEHFCVNCSIQRHNDMIGLTLFWTTFGYHSHLQPPPSAVNHWVLSKMTNNGLKSLLANLLREVGSTEISYLCDTESTIKVILDLADRLLPVWKSLNSNNSIFYAVTLTTAVNFDTVKMIWKSSDWPSTIKGHYNHFE